MKRYKIMWIGSGQQYAQIRGWDDVIDPPSVMGTYDTKEEAEIEYEHCKKLANSIHFLKPKCWIEEQDVCL